MFFLVSSFQKLIAYLKKNLVLKPSTYKRVHYMVFDPLEVGVAPAIFPCIFIPPSIVEPLLLEAKIH